jgi:site-specific recombinase XerC
MDVGAPAKDAKTPLSVVVTGWIASTLEASDLKPSHVEQLAVRMRVKGCSPSTVRQTYTVLRSVLETAVRDELLAANPAARVQRPGVPRTEALPHDCR